MGDRKCYQRGKIGKHSLAHITMEKFEENVAAVITEIKSSYKQEHEESLTRKLTKYLDILADEDTQVALDNKALEITKDVTTAHQENSEETAAVERDILS